MDFVLPAFIKKTISFRRLTSKNVVSYEVYAHYKDNNYKSGIRTELLDTIINPSVPTPVLKRIPLNYNDNITWELPYDAYLDKDYRFRLYLNDTLLNSLQYKYNRLSKLITLNIDILEYTVNDKLELEYYQDIITKEYMPEENCEITIKPVFKDGFTYGTHNVII